MRKSNWTSEQEFESEVEKARKFLADHQVTATFAHTGQHSWAEPSENRVRIVIISSCVDLMWSASLHELAHVLIYREGQFQEYHVKWNSDMSRAEKLRAYRDCVKAETRVDDLAEAIFDQLRPGVFTRSYDTYAERAWLKDHVKKALGLNRKRRKNGREQEFRRAG